MEKKNVSILSWIPFLLFLPYLFISFCNGRDLAFTRHMPDPEDCLPALLSAQIPEDYETETLKAQAVIARTNLYRKTKEKERIRILDEMGQEWKKVEEKSRQRYRILFRNLNIYEEAVRETKGQVLTYNRKLVLLPFHKISSGKTRDGIEVFHDVAYDYLVSVDSMEDRKSPEYEKSYYISKQLLPSDLRILSVDSQGYVTLFAGGGKLLEGEAFRLSLLLPSSNVTVKELPDSFLFECRGSGHGVGLSQYGGNALAERGKDYQEILQTYFPKLTLQKLQ